MNQESNEIISQLPPIIQNQLRELLVKVKTNMDQMYNERFNEARQAQLQSLIVKLFSGGISSIEIFLHFSPRDLLGKGFTLREAYILIRELGRQSQQFFPRPSNTEIDNLQYDQEIKQLALYKMALEQPGPQNQKNKYVLILGPQKTGKTIFLFNLINIYYDVDVDSLYRVKKQNQNNTNSFYQEYLIEMAQDENLIFVDFVGMGDLERDIIGHAQNNFFQVLLEYIQDKNVIAALFVNSASINRLGQEEAYTIQRFFELFHQSFSQSIFLILTFCTDNNPLLSVYSHRSSPTPSFLKNNINQYLDQLEQNQIPNEELKFWFGINNNYLYFPAIDLDNESEQILINHRNINYQNFKQDCDIIEEGIDLSQQFQEQDNFSIQDQEINVTQRQVLQFYFEIMRKELLKIQSKINRIFNSQNLEQNKQHNYFRRLQKLEKEIHELGIQPNIDNLIQPNKNTILTTNYIGVKKMYEKKSQKASQGKKILFCTDCQRVCHHDCELEKMQDLASAKKNCQKMIIDFKVLSQMNNPTRLIEEKNLDLLYYCKECSLRDIDERNKIQSKGNLCLISKHILIQEVSFDVNDEIYYISNSQVQRDFKHQYDNLKRMKQLHTMKLTLNLNKQSKFQQKVQSIKLEIADINKSKEGLIPINVQVRIDLLEKTMKAGIQLKTDKFQTILNVYNKFSNLKKQQVIRGNNKIVFQLYKLVQKDIDIDEDIDVDG